MLCSGHGPPGAFGLVAKEQFVEHYENTAVLLGLDVRTEEVGSGAGCGGLAQ